MARSLRIRYDTREAFCRAWEETLSRGAVFVHVADPPRLQARVMVEIELAFARGKATLEGEVVQHVPAAAGEGAGVGVQFLAPLAKIREGLGRFAQAAAGSVQPAAAPKAPSAAQAAAVPAARAAASTSTAAVPAPNTAGDDGLFDDDDLFGDEARPAVQAAPGAARASAPAASAAPAAGDAAAADADAWDFGDDDALDLGAPMEPPADAAALDADAISDADLEAVLGTPGAAPAPELPATRTLAPRPHDPEDPYGSLDPGALDLSMDTAEPEPAPEMLPPEGHPYDPHERELD